MNYTEFIKETNISNILALLGDDFLMKKSIEHIKKILGNLDNTSISIFDAEDYNCSSVLNACEQMSFFNEKRLVIVKNVLLGEQDKARFTSYAKNPNWACYLVFYDCQNLPNVEKVDCSALYDSEIKKLVSAWADEQNKTIEPKAISMLIEYTQKNLTKIKNYLNW